MKKLFSLFLLLSIFVSSTNVLALGADSNTDGQDRELQDQAAQVEKLQKDLQLFALSQGAVFDNNKEVNFEQYEQGFDQEQVDSQDSAYKLKNGLQSSKNETILDNVKKIAKIVAVTGVTVGIASGASYLAYKACDKVGLNKEIKSVIELIGKTKILKNLVLCGIFGSALCTAIAGYLVYQYGRDFAEAHIIAMYIMAQMRQA